MPVFSLFESPHRRSSDRSYPHVRLPASRASLRTHRQWSPSDPNQSRVYGHVMRSQRQRQDLVGSTSPGPARTDRPPPIGPSCPFSKPSRAEDLRTGRARQSSHWHHPQPATWDQVSFRRDSRWGNEDATVVLLNDSDFSSSYSPTKPTPDSIATDASAPASAAPQSNPRRLDA